MSFGCFGVGRTRRLLLTVLGVPALWLLTADARGGLFAQRPVGQRSLAPAPSPVLARPPAIAAGLVLQGATVVDVTNGRLIPDQTVVVAGTRVLAVGPAGQLRVPAGAKVVDARGKYLIPGLWNMHVHLYRGARSAYPQFIAYGVTGVREMTQRYRGGVDSFRVRQRDIAAGTLAGPRAIGPSVDFLGGKDSPNGSRATIRRPADAQRVVDSLKAAGFAFIKYYDGGDREAYLALLRAGRRAGLPIVGHGPWRGWVTEDEIADSGQRSVEHSTSHPLCWQAVTNAADSAEIDPQWMDLWRARRAADTAGRSIDQQCARAAAAYIRNGTWLTPTLVAHYEGFEHKRRFGFPPVRADRNGAYATRVHRLLYRHGVRRFLAGSDWTDDKFSLLEELVVLVELGGLTPLEALQAATLHPAQFLEATDSLGTVAPGKLADLVLLDRNPLADIRHVMTTRAVVANGRYFDRAALDALDPEGIERLNAFARRPLREVITASGAMLP